EMQPRSPANASASPGLLADARELLAQGAYDQALEAALDGARLFPADAAAFRDIAAVATVGLDRQRGTTATAATPEGQGMIYVRHATRHPPSTFAVGFVVGLPIALRLEWRLNRTVVDGMGLAVGENWITDSVGLAGPQLDVSYFVD